MWHKYGIGYVHHIFEGFERGMYLWMDVKNAFI